MKYEPFEGATIPDEPINSNLVVIASLALVLTFLATVFWQCSEPPTGMGGLPQTSVAAEAKQ